MDKVFEIYIKTTPGAPVGGDHRPRDQGEVQLRRGVISDWTPGSRFEMSARGGRFALGEGENLEVDPPRRLVQSMVALWDEDVKSEGTSRVTWEIEPVGDSCRLTVTHDQLREGANEQLYGGWPMILSGLKTLARDGRAADDAGIADVRPSPLRHGGRVRPLSIRRYPPGAGPSRRACRPWWGAPELGGASGGCAGVIQATGALRPAWTPVAGHQHPESSQ